MGCASSSSGHIINTRQSVVKLQQILATNNQKQESIANGKTYLFGQTRTQRKIIQCETKMNAVKIISNKVRIPCPKIHQDPLEVMYEQSQQLFHLGTYGYSMLPPFNKMLALYLQSSIIIMCGGRDYDNYNVKNEAFFYSAQDNKIMSQITSLHQLSAKPETRPKYARSRFQKMASMNRKRHSHMGIYSKKLKSVLVFGGIDQKNETLAECQIYNIFQNVWRDLPAMKIPRADGLCFEYANKVYLFGGRSSLLKLSKKIGVFSLQQLTWKVLKFKIHRGIENALVFSQAPNQLLIVGGATHFYNCKTVIKIDLKQQTYEWDSQLNKEYSHTKGVKMGQDLLIFGGQKDTCQIFTKKRWKAGLLTHRKIIEIEELQDFSFTQQSLVIKSSESTSSILHTCSQEENVFFGTDDYPCVIFYNKNTGIIRKCSVPMLLRLKKKMQIVQLPNKFYMLLGGCDRQEKKISRSCFIYDAKLNKAKQSLKMADKKINFATVYFQSQLYIFGGFNPVQNAGQISCQKFNFQQQKWVQLRRLNKAKYKTFAQKIGENKIAVFGKQYKNTPVTQIQIYYTKRDYYDTFVLTGSIPHQISMVYGVAQQNKIIILRQNQSNTIQQIEITEQKLIEKELQKSARILEQQMENIIIHSTENQEQQGPHQIPYIKEKEHIQSEYESSQLHKSNMVVKKPKLIEIKPVQCDSLEERVQEQLEDSSFQVEKIAQFNKTINDSIQSGFKELKTSQKQIQQNSNFQDDVRCSLNHSFEANLSPVSYKRSMTGRKLSETKNLKNIEDISIELSQKYSVKQLQGISKQKHNIIKRQSQLYFFNLNEVTHFDILTNEKIKHKIEMQEELKLFHIK